MSTSTDAILFWGIHYENEADTDEDETVSEGIADTIYEAIQEDKERELPKPDDETYKGPEWDAWREKAKAWDREQCEVDNHCSGDYPMPYVAVVASKTTAWRGKPQEITSLIIDPTWEPKLRAFCERFGLPWKEPKWWLVSYWG